MSTCRQWYDDPYWTDALEAWQDFASSGEQIVLDIKAVERAVYMDPSPAFKLQEAMAAIEADDDPDRLRGVPRVFFALLMRLREVSLGRGVADQN